MFSIKNTDARCLFSGKHYNLDTDKLDELPALTGISPYILGIYGNKGKIFEYPSKGSNQPTKRDFLLYANQCNTLYFAVHGTSKPDNPLDYALILRSSREDEGNTIKANEIEATSFSQLYLTVLGACETQTGEIDGGEGVMSLAYRFQMAGSRHVVASLNGVPPDNTAKILKPFFENYKVKKMSIPEALYQAKLTYLDTPNLSEGHPWFWGNLIHIGFD